MIISAKFQPSPSASIQEAFVTIAKDGSVKEILDRKGRICNLAWLPSWLQVEIAKVIAGHSSIHAQVILS